MMQEYKVPERLRGLGKSLIRDFFDRAPQGSINLGLGEPDLRTPDVINRAAIKVIADEQNGYTTHAGLVELREKIAGEYTGASSDACIVTAGSQEALYLALMSLVDAGDEVLIPNPGFVAYSTIIKIAGGNVKTYRLPKDKDFGFDVDEFEKSVTNSTKVVIVTSPSNPTGRAFDEKDLQAIADVLNNTKAFVISDEIYRELYFGDARPATIADFYPRTLVVSGLSKAMSMTGWRLGWLCGTNIENSVDGEAVRACLNAALVLHGYTVTCASTVSQKAALASWTTEGEAARAQSRRIFKRRRDVLIDLLGEAKLRAVIPEGAFYVMVDVARYGLSIEVAEKCLQQQVITVPGVAFGSESEGYLRVSFCADEDKLQTGVKRLQAGIEN